MQSISSLKMISIHRERMIYKRITIKRSPAFLINVIIKGSGSKNWNNSGTKKFTNPYTTVGYHRDDCS